MDMLCVHRPAMLLMGMSYFGDPFRDAGDWSMNNEIGRLSARFMDFAEKNREILLTFTASRDFYEVHIYNEETNSKGFFEVFVGLPTTGIDDLPVELSAKRLPACQYAQIDLKGEAINSDWYLDLDRELERRGWRRGYAFFFQVYDQRFKGMDRIAESELSAYIPIVPFSK
jgi:predicted transcriptional regulator YdeE